MGMANGVGTGIAVSEINVTPLIDVLLVLLIIFMVIVPVTPKGLDALIPQPPKAQAEPPLGMIVVSVLANAGGEPSYRISQDSVSRAEIEPRLAQIFAARHEKTIFVKADKSMEFSRVAEIINMGHEAQVDAIGLINPSD
ncbi:MAG: biopolymer transporter ExbD [Acidobacteriota bacterium]|nr:biopolymer transporter ExbD [Acidobacteriota bacterium]